MKERQTAYANPKARTILPRHGIGAPSRVTDKPVTTAYDLSQVPSRVYEKPVNAAKGKPVIPKKKTKWGARKEVSDPFLDRLSRLN